MLRTIRRGDQAALLRAVIADPDDDLPRLVYADWLDEHGQDERAEFIRLHVGRSVQVTAAEDFQALKGSSEYRDRMERIQLLRWTHGRRWAAEIAPGFLRERSGPPPWFERGFIEEASLPARAYLRELDRIYANTPLRKVRLTHPDDRPPVDLQPLAAHPGFGSVEDLEVTGPVSPDGFAALAASPHAGRVRRVEIRGRTVSAAWVGTALAGPWASVVRSLSLDNNEAGDDGAVALANTPRVGGVLSLSLGGNQITDRRARALAASPHLGSCEFLWMGGNRSTREGEGLLRERFGGRVST